MGILPPATGFTAVPYPLPPAPASCVQAVACVINERQVAYDQSDIDQIMGLGQDTATGVFRPIYTTLVGLGLENAPSGQSFYLGNAAGGELHVTTGGAGANTRVRAYGMYVDTGSGANNNIAMQNDGKIIVYDTAQIASQGDHSAGMSVFTNDGGGHSIWMNNAGSIEASIDSRRGNAIAVIGLQVQAQSSGRATGVDTSMLYNGGTIDVSHTGGGQAWGIRQFSRREPLEGTVINAGIIRVSSSGQALVPFYFPGGVNAAMGIRSDTAGSEQSTLRSYNYGSIFVEATANSGAAHGMYSAVDSAEGRGVSFDLQNHGLLDVRSRGSDGYASGLTVGTGWGGDQPIMGQALNGEAGRMIVDAGESGIAYGIYALLDTPKKGAAVGIASVLNVSNKGIIDTRGQTAHQLFVTRMEAGDVSGTAYVSEWNLALNRAASADQRVFAVANGATLNLGDAQGIGSHLILRTGSEGDSGHSDIAVSELIAIKGGYAVGRIERVSSGGDQDGQRAGDYQATLEGYASYVNQHLYLDRAWQYNGWAESKGAVRCATIQCALYSSTHGLSLVNQGTLDITIAGETLAALYVNLRAQHGVENPAVRLDNAGEIAVNAGGDSGRAYGMYVRLQDADQQAIIHNTGTITVTGATAHALYVSGEQGNGGTVSSGSGGTARVATWSVALQDRSSGQQSLFAVAEGARLHFGDEVGNGSHLILRPGDSTQGYADNKRFNLSDMVYNYGNGAQVSGKIGSVSTPLPMLVAHYGYRDPAGSRTWDNQWVSLDVDAGKSDDSALGAGVIDSMENQVERIGHILLDGSHRMGNGENEVQMKVYYGHLQRRGVGAADTDSVGTVAYADYSLSPDATLGWHGGIEHAWLKAQSNTLRTRAVSAVMGVQGRYNLDEAAYLRSQISGILSHDQNHFSAFDGSRASASATNLGLYGALYAGYDYRVARHNTITPELGVATLWTYRPSLAVNYDRSADLNHAYATQYDQFWYASAGVRWRGQLDIGGIVYQPTLMGGVKHAIGGADINTTMTFNGQRFSATLPRDRTRGVVDVGISSALNARFDMGINYRGEYGNNMTDHIGYVNGTLRF
ncbi:Putative autotransporter protein [Edwardsiella anguillarum ET080813]|uniref:Putative autotransporter protein n=1 Tax=Edwardsiella anguillarum ET080813 TaxID=667120 RepID=A0A076LUE0_9GAMM|nr:Putative autotransporter protein [Edwardsiella anguillarum ET080813]